MTEYRIFTTEEFDKAFAKLDKSIQKSIDDEIEQLEKILMLENHQDLNSSEKKNQKFLDFIT